MTQQYFQKGLVTFRDLQNALLNVGGGGLESWDPITEPTKIQAGIYTAPGSFILLEDYNGSPIDDISSGSRGDIIYFFPNNNRWGVISAEDKNKGVYQTLTQLQTAYPIAQNGDYALVVATSTFYAWFNSQWNNTGSNVAPDALRSTNNLSDLTDAPTARTNLDVYSKSQTNTQISGGVFSNANIATNANIETSKIKQTTITPNTNTPANNDTQDVLNNKFTGNISEVKTKIDNLPVGASSGDTLFLTNTDSAIIGYKTLSKQPSTASQQAITTTANNNEVLASSFVNPIQIGLTKLNGGIWQINLFAYAAHSGSCRVIAKFYSRATSNTETLLFTATSPFILSTDLNNPDILSIESPQQDFTVAATDLLVVKIFVSTTRTQNTNITYYHSGSTFFSHIHTPLVPSHNDLKGIQGGSAGEYNHLTNAQVALVNDVVNRIPKVPTATVNNFAIFDVNGNIIDSAKNANSFEPADATILKEAEVIDNLTSTAINLPLSANQGKFLQDNKLSTSSAPDLIITTIVGALLDSNSIDFVYYPDTKRIEANLKIIDSSKIALALGISGLSATIVSNSLIDADVNSVANIATSKIKTGTLVGNTNDIASNDLLSDIINKIASLLPVFNNAVGKYLSANKTWSDLNQNSVGISSDVRRDGNDNIVLSDQLTTDAGTQNAITIRLGNTTTSSTKGGDLILQPSNGTAGSGDIVMQVAPLPINNIEIGTNTSYANANIQNATFSHTVPSNKSSRLLLVSFATAVSAPATAVTYGGVVMTEISSGPVASTSVNVQTYYLINPTAGTANVIITRASSGSIVANAVNIANVNQITPISNTVETFSNTQTTSASLTLTSTTADQIAIGVIGVINVTPTLGAGQVAIFNASSESQERGVSSYELVTGSTATVSYSFASSSFAFQAFTINKISSSSLGQMQEVLRVNSQGTYANNVKRTLIYQSGQTLALTEDLPQTLIFTSSVVSNSTIRLPDATRMLVGTTYDFINYNASTITVNNYGGSQLGQVIGNNNRTYFTLTDNSTTNGVWVASVDITRGNFANTFSNRKIIYLSPNGNDLNNGFSQESAVLTLSQALTLAGNVGNQIEVLPGTYAGNYTITQQNISIIGSNNEGRGICNFTGTLTLNNTNSASSQLLQGLSLATVSNTGSGGVYIKGCTINTALSNSTSSYMQVERCDIGTAQINITGAGNKNFIGCNGGIYTINNASAILNVKDCLTVVSPTLTSGVLAISNATIYALTNGGFAINTAIGSLLYLSNSNIINPDGTAAKINSPAGSFYSLSNINYDRANSTLNGTNLNREFNFDNIRANFLNGISNTVFQYISGLSSNAQTQLNNKQPLNANLTNLATMANITNADANKTFTVDANGNLALVAPSSGGNVSVSGLSGISNGELALFSSANGTTLTKIDGTTSQRRVLSKNSKLIASFTTTERDAILDWQSGEVIYNSTNSFAESYNGTTWIQNYRDTTDFVNWIANGVNAGGTLVGNAIWATALGSGSKNGVSLTTNNNNQKGFWYKAIPQIAHKRIVLYADHLSGGGTGADGIFYSIFANTPPTASTEPFTANNSYTIFFDEYLDEVTLRYNGIILQTVPFVGLDNNDIKQIRIVIDYNPLTNLSRIFAELKGAGFSAGVCIDYNDTVARNLTGQYVFACGYTSGQNNYHELHHLAIRKFYEY